MSELRGCSERPVGADLIRTSPNTWRIVLHDTGKELGVITAPQGKCWDNTDAMEFALRLYPGAYLVLKDEIK